MAEQDLAFARLLTGRYDGIAALDDIEQHYPGLDMDNFLPVDSVSEFLGGLLMLISSNAARQSASDQLGPVRTLAASHAGNQVLKLAIPRCADDIVLALTTEDQVERDSTLVSVIGRLVSAVAFLASPRPKVNGVFQRDLHVAPLVRPKPNDPTFAPVDAIPAPVERKGDFEIQGLFSDNDLVLGNPALFRILTRQTLSGAGMTFEDQFLRQLAWKVSKPNFEQLYERLLKAPRPVFKTVKGIPRNWPGWSENGGVLMTLPAYLDAVTKIQFRSLTKFLQSVELTPHKKHTIQVLNELRGLWILRHLSLVELESCHAHTFTSIKPLIDTVSKDFATLTFDPSIDQASSSDASGLLPSSVEQVLRQSIASHDTLGRFVTSFAGGDFTIEQVAQIPPGVLARILVSSGHELYQDPIFAQVVARDVSKSIRDHISISPDNTSSPAGTTYDGQNNQVSVRPTVDAYLRHGKPGSNLDTFEMSVVRTTSLNASKSFDLERQMAKSGLSADSAWAYDPETVMVSAIEPFAAFTGSLAAVGKQESQDPNVGYAVSVMADRLSSQTYFTDGATIAPRMQTVSDFPTLLGDWQVFFPRGFFAATIEMIDLVDVLARIAPLDGIESNATALQQLAGRRVELATGPSATTVTEPSFDAETYPVMDFVHSGFTGYRAPMGRSWAALKHTLIRQGVELVTDNSMAALVESVNNENHWTWTLANGTRDALDQIYVNAATMRSAMGNEDFTVRTSFDKIDGLAEPLEDGIHPASLLAAFVSGDVQLDLGDTQTVYTKHTAPLMAFIVQMRLTDMAIMDLGVPLFTSNFVFDYLKVLTEAMIQADQQVIRQALKTPLGEFVVHAARMVADRSMWSVEEPEQLEEDIEKINDRRDAALQAQSWLRATSNNSISLDDRKYKERRLDMELVSLASKFRIQRMQAVASAYPKVSDALARINALVADDREIVVPRAYVLPVYAILPEFSIGPVRAVAETDDCMFDANGMRIRDGVLFGVNAQLNPNRFATEVQDAIMHGRSLYGGSALPPDQLETLTDQLKASTEAIFGLGALVSDPDNESVRDIVDIATLLIGDPSDDERVRVAKLAKTTDPLYRLYPEEPFDASPALIGALSSKLLGELNKALAFRKKIRTPLKSGVTIMELFGAMKPEDSQVALSNHLSLDLSPDVEVSFESLKRLKDNPLANYETSLAPWSFEIRSWVNGSPQRGNQDTWKNLVVTGRSLVNTMIQSRISVLETGIVDQSVRDFAENAAFVLDRLIAEGNGMASTQGLRTLKTASSGLGSFDGEPGPTTMAIVKNSYDIRQPDSLFISMTDGQDVLNSMLADPDVQIDARNIMRELGYFSMRDLMGEPEVQYTLDAGIEFVPDQDILVKADTIALIEALYVMTDVSAITGRDAQSRNIVTFINSLGRTIAIDQLIGQASGDDLRAEIIAAARQLGIDQAIMDFAASPSTSVAVREVIKGRVTFTHVADPFEFRRSSSATPLKLEDAFNMPVLRKRQNLAKAKRTTTCTGRFGMWSPQVRGMLYFADALGTRFDTKYVIWPYIRDMYNKSKGIKANVTKEGIGLSATMSMIGSVIKWHNNIMPRIGNHVIASFATLLYQELEQVRQQVSNDDWNESYPVSHLVDDLLGSKDGFSTFEYVARSIFELKLASKGESIQGTVQSFGAHVARCYTAAPELIVRNRAALSPHINVMLVARALEQVRHQSVFDNNFLSHVSVGSRWNDLPMNRKTWTDSQKGTTHPRYVLWQAGNVAYGPTPEMTYRVIQSQYNAAHAMSIIDQLNLIDKTRPFVLIENEGRSERIQVFQPAVLVAGMLRSTEPLVIRLEADEFGLQIPDAFSVLMETPPGNFEDELIDLDNFRDALPILAARVLEMVESISNDTVTEDVEQRKNVRSGASTLPAISKANQDIIRSKQFALDRYRQLMRTLFASRATLQTTSIDFSGYVSELYKVNTKYLIVNRAEIQSLWSILNFDDGGTESAFDIQVCAKSFNGRCQKSRKPQKSFVDACRNYAEDTRMFTDNIDDFDVDDGQADDYEVASSLLGTSGDDQHLVVTGPAPEVPRLIPVTTSGLTPVGPPALVPTQEPRLIPVASEDSDQSPLPLNPFTAPLPPVGSKRVRDDFDNDQDFLDDYLFSLQAPAYQKPKLLIDNIDELLNFDPDTGSVESEAYDTINSVLRATPPPPDRDTFFADLATLASETLF